MSILKFALVAGAVTLLAACQTIPYNDQVAKTVSDYAIEADRHIVAVRTAWNRCYEKYDAIARARDKRLILSKDVGTALILATEVDDIGISTKEAVRQALMKLLADGRVDAFRRIDEPFRGYLTQVLDDTDLNPLIGDIVKNLTAPAAPGQSEADRRKTAADKTVAFLYEGEADRAKCTDAGFAHYEDAFYDDWSSKLFAVQQIAKADDVLGLCSKVGALVKKHADTVNEKIFKTDLAELTFENGTECSLATIGGVLVQHENLRRYHKDLIVIDEDNGKFWRETLAQSARIALTVENLKKSVSEDSGPLF